MAYLARFKSDLEMVDLRLRWFKALRGLFSRTTGCSNSNESGKRGYEGHFVVFALPGEFYTVLSFLIFMQLLLRLVNSRSLDLVCCFLDAVLYIIRL